MEIAIIIFTVLLSSVVAIVLYFFFAPFYLEVNSRVDLYRIRFHHLFSIALKLKEDAVIETTILGWRREKTLPTLPPNPKVAEGKITAGNSRQLPLKKLLHLVDSFKVNKCYVNLDFGDMQLNGILYPLFSYAGWHFKKKILINFSGRNIVILEMENSLARMSRAWLSSKI